MITDSFKIKSIEVEINAYAVVHQVMRDSLLLTINITIYADGLVVHLLGANPFWLLFKKDKIYSFINKTKNRNAKMC